MASELTLPTSMLDPKVEANLGTRGNHRYKHTIRAAFRAVSFITLLAAFCAYSYFTRDEEEAAMGRRLSADLDIPSATVAGDSEGRKLDIFEAMFQETAEPRWLLFPYIVGVLYLFLALAIVCDEFFVPALEVMSDPDHLNLSMDIAGATLMAAGGSAPELFTSIIGTFKRSEVGFGTIVGSAVFNVLFVIAMCAIFSTEVLQLTWWPLARDCSYYVVGLLVLAIFVGVVSPEEIQLWEALILFFMYFGYVLLMAFNRQIYKKITGEELDDGVEEEESKADTKPIHFNWPHTFRAGLLEFINDPTNWRDKARVGFLYMVSGNFDQVFDSVDSNRDGDITRDELEACFSGLDVIMEDDELDKVMEDLDHNRDGKIQKSEFKIWYIHSEKLLKERVRKVFDRYDSNNSNTIARHEFLTMVEEIDPSILSEEREEAASELYPDINYQVPFDEFADWYFTSAFYVKQKEKIAEEEAPETLCDKLAPPSSGGCFAMLKWAILLPITGTLTLTIPDSTKGNRCYIAFVLSIVWIGVYSFFMVGWAETIGATVGIPTYIMGLTFLAAGTSVPDLLSSVIVAKMGEGDMAVSSSIGSNIFDILVGLPFPWLLFILWDNGYKVVTIGAEGIWLSIMILLAMIVAIIITIHFQGWKLTNTLAYIMFGLYIAFLAQALIREYA